MSVIRDQGHRDHFGARYGDILPYFCQISHTFVQRGYIRYHTPHNILKYFPQKIYWWIVQLKMTMIYDFKSCVLGKGHIFWKNISILLKKISLLCIIKGHFLPFFKWVRDIPWGKVLDQRALFGGFDSTLQT